MLYVEDIRLYISGAWDVCAYSSWYAYRIKLLNQCHLVIVVNEHEIHVSFEHI